MPSTVPHKLFWARYFFKVGSFHFFKIVPILPLSRQVHLIDKQEVKRQVLKKRAEETKVDSDSEINWDEDEELEGPEIPGEGTI